MQTQPEDWGSIWASCFNICPVLGFCQASSDQLVLYLLSEERAMRQVPSNSDLIREIFFAVESMPHRCFQSRFGQVVESLSKSCSKCAIEASSKEQMVHEAPKKERDVEKFFLLCMFLGRFWDFETIERVERCWTRQVEAHIGDIGPRS